MCGMFLYEITEFVAATSFFTGEVEIFDFVTERVKRCIAAKRENGWRDFGKPPIVDVVEYEIES